MKSTLGPKGMVGHFKTKRFIQFFKGLSYLNDVQRQIGANLNRTIVFEFVCVVTSVPNESAGE